MGGTVGGFHDCRSVYDLNARYTLAKTQEND